MDSSFELDPEVLLSEGKYGILSTRGWGFDDICIPDRGEYCYVVN